MSYTALYRKYRPSTFDDIAGQQHIVQTLTNALEQNRLAHAYLFTGPSGNGKTSIAKLFAKAINCESPDEIICDKCSNCIETKNNIHPDVVEIDAASNNGVDEIRSLIEKVKYSPLKGKYKIYIIDEVHMLSLGAFNALLKTLEEPPAHVVFILATTEPHKVIPTIISRCQRYDFTRVKEEDIYNNILKVLKGEEIAYDSEAIKLISTLADGGVRNSLSILEQSVAYSPELVTVEDIRKIYGIVTKEEKIDILNNIFDQNMQATLEMLDNISNKGNDLERFNIDLVNILKESVIYSYAKTESLLETLDKSEVDNILSKVSTKQLLAMIDILMEIDAAKKNISDLLSYLELGFIKMISISKTDEQSFESTNSKLGSSDALKKPISLPKLNQEKEDGKKLSVEEVEAKFEKSFIKKDEKNDAVNLEKVKEIVSDKDGEESQAKVEVEISDEMLLSMLTFADKQKRINIQPAWEKIVNYCNQVDVAKYAHKLCKSTIMAIGDNYVVVVVDHQSLALDLNSPLNQPGLTQFLKSKLNEELRVFAVTKEKSTDLIETFKTRAASNDLPEEVTIEIKKEENKTKTDDLLNKASEIFGKEGFIVEE